MEMESIKPSLYQYKNGKVKFSWNVDMGAATSLLQSHKIQGLSNCWYKLHKIILSSKQMSKMIKFSGKVYIVDSAKDKINRKDQ